MTMDGMFLYLWILVLEPIMVASSPVFQDFDFSILNPTILPIIYPSSVFNIED